MRDRPQSRAATGSGLYRTLLRPPESARWKAVALPALAIQRRDSRRRALPGPISADPEKRGALRAPVLAWGRGT